MILYLTESSFLKSNFYKGLPISDPAEFTNTSAAIGYFYFVK